MPLRLRGADGLEHRPHHCADGIEDGRRAVVPWLGWREGSRLLLRVELHADGRARVRPSMQASTIATHVTGARSVPHMVAVGPSAPAKRRLSVSGISHTSQRPTNDSVELTDANQCRLRIDDAVCTVRAGRAARSILSSAQTGRASGARLDESARTLVSSR